MTVWYVYREQGEIKVAFDEPQPGYAEEALDDATNAEIQAYRARVTAPPIPQKVTNLQMRRALRQLGHLDAVNGYAQQQGGDVLDGWEYANDLHYDDPLISAAAQALGLDKDALFWLATSK